MWHRKKEKKEEEKIIPNIVDTSFSSNAQGQRTHSARTKNVYCMVPYVFWVYAMVPLVYFMVLCAYCISRVKCIIFVWYFTMCVHECVCHCTMYLPCTYGSISPGREFGPLNVTFLLHFQALVRPEF